MPFEIWSFWHEKNGKKRIAITNTRNKLGNKNQVHQDTTICVNIPTIRPLLHELKIFTRYNFLYQQRKELFSNSRREDKDLSFEAGFHRSAYLSSSLFYSSLESFYYD
mmetsp:Transcript_5770/g.14315  ORF Transcript_5770/g.14315 Transcript_5770/m.14315 type:complete len:108 (-) Transcript_5770:156-479(-)